MIVTVIGLGKLGGPMAASFASKGFRVFGYDVNEELLKAYRLHECPIQETNLRAYLDLFGEHIYFTTDLEEAIAESALSFVIVPTPSGPDDRFQNRYVEDALKAIAPFLQLNPFHTVVVTSTVMPGSMAKFKDLLENLSGLRMGDGFGLCYAPEFIALGSVIQNFLNPDFVLIGSEDPRSRNALDNCYAQLFGSSKQPPRAYCSFVNAELAKLALNCYVTMKISFANQVGLTCNQVPGADVDQVLGAIGLDSRIGSKYLKAGTAFGGPCFPRDNKAFLTVGDRPNELSRTVHFVNLFTTDWLVDQVAGYPQDTNILVLGMAYKAGTPVTEESASYKLVYKLRAQGFRRIFMHDPLIDSDIPGLDALLRKAEVVYLMVPQKAYQDIEKDIRSGVLVVDPWRALRPESFDCYRAFGRGNAEG